MIDPDGERYLLGEITEDELRARQAQPGQGAPSPARAVPGELRWFALETRTMKENLVVLALQHAGVACRMPMELRTVRQSRYAKASKPRAFPVFWGYVFVGFGDGEIPWRRVLGLHHVRGVVTFGGRAALMPHTWEGELDASRFLSPEREAAAGKFDVGDLVTVTWAGLDRMPGKVVKVGEKKAKVLMELFKRTMEVEIPLSAAVRSG